MNWRELGELHLAHADRIAMAVVHLLNGDPLLSRIVKAYRVLEQHVAADRPLPFISVAPSLSAHEQKLSMQGQSEWTIHIAVHLDEYRYELETGEPSVVSLQDLITRILAANPRLSGTPYSPPGVDLVDRMLDTGAGFVEFLNMAEPGQAVGVTGAVTLEVRYGAQKKEDWSIHGIAPGQDAVLS